MRYLSVAPYRLEVVHALLIGGLNIQASLMHQPAGMSVVLGCMVNSELK